MIKFRTDFNCCKTVSCNNFGELGSRDYIYKSRRLGYLSIECKLCGSNPPWVNNVLVNQVLKEKVELQFGRKILGCPKCYPCFFITEETDIKLHGFTSAGTQRKRCSKCHSVFSLPNYKNIAALKSVLSAIIENKEVRTGIESTALSARLYYFYLDKLALILSNFSRINEEKVINREYLALHTQGQVVHLAHQRGFFSLITSELSSGYILLQNNNLTKQPLQEKDIYGAQKNTVILTKNFDRIENALIDRYQQNLNRKHFEQLLVGELKPVTKCNLIYPDKLTYIHFQLLKAFTIKSAKYDHCIEHESCFRAAALMASFEDIKVNNAGVYYFFPFSKKNGVLQGKEIGWWKDKWYSNEAGAYCPITPETHGKVNFELMRWDSISVFEQYIDERFNKGVNSMGVINNLCDIHRVIFNYCHVEEGQTCANRFVGDNNIYTPLSLLDEALKMLMEK